MAVPCVVLVVAPVIVIIAVRAIAPVVVWAGVGMAEVDLINEVCFVHME
jgi:hypothetical protein